MCYYLNIFEFKSDKLESTKSTMMRNEGLSPKQLEGTMLQKSGVVATIILMKHSSMKTYAITSC